MDRAEGALLVAEKALRAARDLAEKINGKKNLIALAISETGDVVLSFGDGSIEKAGKIVGPPGPPGRDGIDGKDTDPEFVRALVTETFASIPPPRDGIDGAPGPAGEPGRPGRDGKDADPEFVRSLVTAAVAALPPARDGIDGKDADPIVIRALVEEAVNAIPKPADGRDGKDGRDGSDVDPEFVRSLVTEAVSAIPPAPPGEKGEPGPAGRDGVDADVTKIAAEIDDRFNALREQMKGEIGDAIGRAVAVADEIKRSVDAALATVPRGFLVNADGNLVFVRRDGTTETAGRVRGDDGTAPPGVDSFSQDADGNLIAHMTDGRSQSIGLVRGTDGRHGKDGAPGLGFDDMRWEYDGERTMTLIMERDGQKHTQSFYFPLPLDRGIWREGEYEIGDAVTRDGAIWLAQKTTTATPGVGPDNGWRLAVKSARNGRSAYEIARAAGFSGTEKEWLASLKGPEGKQGPPGVPGRDRT